MKSPITRSAVVYALVAAIFFALGVVAGGGTNSIASSASHLPLFGDGLDASPDASLNLADFWKAYNTLNAEYVQTHASTTIPDQKAKVFGMIQGLAASYGDPYTVFFPPAQAKAFNENIQGNFGGVGIEIDIKNNVLTVIAPLKGTPAALAGIKSGDQILGINGKATDGVPLDQIVSQIRGEVGTTVEFIINRAGQRLDIKVQRQTIQVPEEDDSLDKSSGVYKIALYEFTSNSAQLFDDAFTRFKQSGAKYLIIDLRGNPGGYLDAAVDIASHFLPKGTKIVTEDSAGKQPSTVHSSLGYSDLPAGTKVAVLVDGGSASASEILAGALQDNHAAEIIGQQSFGKGSVQQLVDIDGGSLKVTVARWITPAGHWIMGNGITPDIKVAYSTGSSTPATDPQIARATQFLTTGK